MGALEEHPFEGFNRHLRANYPDRKVWFNGPRLVETDRQEEAGWIVFFCMVGAALIFAVAVGIYIINGGS